MRGYPPNQAILKISDLPPGRDHQFELSPNSEIRAEIAESLGIRALRKLLFSGELRPAGRKDWHLQGTLGATVIQDCVVTLDPVTSRIDEDVSRSFVTQFSEESEGSEMEMPQDDTIELLPEALDLHALMVEALALALPTYPRTDSANQGMNAGGQVFTEPGKTAMTDEDTKPFASLADLKAKLQNDT